MNKRKTFFALWLMDGMSDVIFYGWENAPLGITKKSDWIDDLLLSPTGFKLFMRPIT